VERRAKGGGMSREVCIHGVPTDSVKICEACINGDYSIGESIDTHNIHLAEDDEPLTEREELVLKCYLALLSGQAGRLPSAHALSMAAKAVDEYLKWREGGRKDEAQTA
jgi:hypothetical protein